MRSKSDEVGTECLIYCPKTVQASLLRTAKGHSETLLEFYHDYLSKRYKPKKSEVAIFGVLATMRE